MEIQTSQKFCIITPLSPKLDARETERLIKEILSNSSKSIGIDLSFVNDCTIDFLDALKNFNISFFNIPSDIFSLITFMNLDKIINLYTTEEDFILQKHRLLNRKFKFIV